MGASHDDRNPSLLEFPRNLVCAGRYRCLGSKTYQIDPFIEVNLLIGLINNPYLHIRRSDGCHIGEIQKPQPEEEGLFFLRSRSGEIRRIFMDYF